ncbi:MAG: hypothetical protein IT428_26500 [Planctomycetaceae bacterium]|nr:hypothetical protein [Planctomycetaceae bacterium]
MPWLMTLILVAGLAMVAGSIGSVFIDRRRSAPVDNRDETRVAVPPPLRITTGSLVASVAWGIPAVAVLALVVLRAAPRFQEAPPPKAEVPEAVHVEVNEPAEVSIKTDSVNTESTTEVDGAVAETPTPAAGTPEPIKENRLKKAARNLVDKITGRKDDPLEAAAPANASNLPEWTRTPVSTEGDKTLIVLSSNEHPTLSEAEAEVRERAIRAINADFEKSHPSSRAPFDWKVPEGAIRFNRAHEEKVVHTVGNVTFTMFRLHRQLEISDATREVAYGAWRQGLVASRLWGAGSVLATLALIVAAVSSYLRLDGATRGAYRTRLKLATVAIIVTGGLAAGSMV